MARIMLADDQNEIRMVLRDMIKIGSHEIAGEAIDGEEAIEKFTKTQPDVLLLDVAMPKKDGLIVVREIISANPKAKIILVTASGNPDTIKECLDAGALAYITKPFDMDKALKIISDIASK